MSNHPTSSTNYTARAKAWIARADAIPHLVPETQIRYLINLMNQDCVSGDVDIQSIIGATRTLQRHVEAAEANPGI